MRWISTREGIQLYAPPLKYTSWGFFYKAWRHEGYPLGVFFHSTTTSPLNVGIHYGTRKTVVTLVCTLHARKPRNCWLVISQQVSAGLGIATQSSWSLGAYPPRSYVRCRGLSIGNTKIKFSYGCVLTSTLAELLCLNFVSIQMCLHFVSKHV